MKKTAATSVPLRSLPVGAHDLGYVEGKNIVVEYRYGERKGKRHHKNLRKRIAR